MERLNTILLWLLIARSIVALEEKRHHKKKGVVASSTKKANNSSSVRIVNGEPAGGVDRFPWMVSLYNRKDPENILPVCGGSLITPSVVLTAAHCIFSIQSAEIGRYDYEANDEVVETFTDIEKRFHPDYEEATFNFDYALVKLERPHPNPFLVDLRRTTEVPSELQIMGWGLLEEDGEQPTLLQTAVVSRVFFEDCTQGYLPEEITENMFCAREDTIDSCQGDSGGPIVVKDTNIQVGVVSWGNGCADPLFPGVYARSSSGMAWIDETVCNDLAPDECIDGRIPIANADGKAIDKTCEDLDEFIGLGKKLKTRTCEWVGERPDTRCRWYGDDYCPATCEVERCE
mmetsp:Transcript_19235/g.27734  ORF Transcript_19235/g.27734 Transcript_19235/m.27734 type:complete len:345 (+) Transcript_19235:64-1098(+)